MNWIIIGFNVSCLFVQTALTCYGFEGGVIPYEINELCTIMESFKRVHGSIKPLVWSPASSPILS